MSRELFTTIPDDYKVIPVDQWEPAEEDKIFKTCKGALILPVSQFVGIDNESLNTFILSTKRCYNGDKMLYHLPLYMNYFEKFYDQDKELLINMYRIKFLLDCEPNYTKEMFINDLNRYIMSDSLMFKAHMMNEDNYNLNLDAKKYRNDKNPSLQYSDRHAKMLMWLSLMYNMMIPLLTHFVFVNQRQKNRIYDTNQFLLEELDYILDYINQNMHIDLYAKLYETSISNINKDFKDNNDLWEMQDIRGENTTTHAIDSVDNIILNIVPKYIYDKNIIFLNYSSIRKNTNFRITGIKYEFNYVSLSASKRDADNNSEFDKFESYQIKQNEALYLQNKVNAEKTIEYIEHMYGPFSQDEINFYKNRLMDDNKEIINDFQRTLVFNLFYKYFGEPISAYAINKDDYVKLIIAAKRLLLANNMIVLPYIISSKVERFQPRKAVNKKELTKLKASKFYEQIREKYRNEKIEQHILSIIATMLASSFRIIDYDDKDLDGRMITDKDIKDYSDIVKEEVMMYAALV